MIPDLEKFKQIPRNDLLIYLHQHEFLENKIKAQDLYDRINKPTYIFCHIIDDLISLSLIETKNYRSNGSKESFFPSEFNLLEIKLTEKGKDYVESFLFGYNLKKYDLDRNPTLSLKFQGFSGRILSLYDKPYDYFNKYKSIDRNVDVLYYLCTGKTNKPNNEKKVFISYAWGENGELKPWVSKLAEDLDNDFQVEFYKNLKYAMSPNNYMKSNILSSDFVLIIFTENYKNRITHLNTGVNIEFNLIQENLIQDDLFRKIPYGKFIPILKDGNKEISIPDTMQDSLYIDFRNNNEYEHNLKNLINHLKD